MKQTKSIHSKILLSQLGELGMLFKNKFMVFWDIRSVTGG